MITPTHDFHESLAKSDGVAQESWWEEIYRNEFPYFHSMQRIEKDGWAQRGGVDRVIHLKSGKSISIDEKVRHDDYDDILLEYWSSKENQAWGWMFKDQICDYIAYVFLPSRRCYFFPFQQLQQAWKNHCEEWKLCYKNVEAKNKGYTTVSVAVPIDILQKAIIDAGFVQWDKVVPIPVTNQ